jgi:hypothetical protein
VAEFNSEPFVSTPDEFAKFTAEDAEKWGKVNPRADQLCSRIWT